MASFAYSEDALHEIESRVSAYRQRLTNLTKYNASKTGTVLAETGDTLCTEAMVIAAAEEIDRDTDAD